MAGFCPNCGKPLEDNAIACTNCGESITPKPVTSTTPLVNSTPTSNPPPDSGSVPVASTTQKTTNYTRSEIMERAIPFFTTRSYGIKTQTDYLVAFQSQDRDVSWFIIIILCCLGLIPAIVYWFWFTHQHEVTVSLGGDSNVKVNAIGNTEKAIKDAADFMQSI